MTDEMRDYLNERINFYRAKAREAYERREREQTAFYDGQVSAFFEVFHKLNERKGE